MDRILIMYNPRDIQELELWTIQRFVAVEYGTQYYVLLLYS